MRWDPYVLSDGQNFEAFWRDHLLRRKRNVLFIVGLGFDVRALDVCDSILAIGGKGKRDLWIVCFDNGVEDTAECVQMTEENLRRFRKAFEIGDVIEMPVKFGGTGLPSATSRNTARAFSTVRGLTGYDDVILDISAMPRMIAMTAIAKLTRVLDDLAVHTRTVVNLHVTTAESLASDRGAGNGSLSDTVTNVVGFSGRLNGQVDEHLPRVWFPILGEGQSERLTLIREELRPDEICPVIPFPSREARRTDEIVNSYRQVLFDEFQVEPRNILHACEFNPFEAYKQLYGAINRYRDALDELGGCKAFVSPLSSKLLSVGALLACMDHGSRVGKLFVGIPYLESMSYGSPSQDANDERELYSMWIRGEWES